MDFDLLWFLLGTAYVNNEADILTCVLQNSCFFLFSKIHVSFYFPKFIKGIHISP
jgi:hypothetical protein